MNYRSLANAMENARAFRALAYALVFLMMVCGVLTMSNLFQSVAPGSHVGILAAIWLFIVIDRIFMHPQLKSLAPFTSEWAIVVGAQWIVMMLFARLLISYANGLDSFLEEISLAARGYFEYFFVPEFIFTFLISLLVWYLCGQFLGLLDEIGLDQKLALRQESIPIQSETIPAHQRLVSLIFGMGLVLVLLTALAFINVRAIVSDTGRIEINRLSGGEAGVLLYFVFGLALLSLSRLMSLQTHWNQLRIPISSKNLTRQWGIYSLCFLLFLAVAVSLLPAGDSLGLFSVLGALFSFLFRVLVFLAQLIVALVLLLFSLPFLLFGTAPPFLKGVTPPPMPVMPPVGTQVSAPNSPVWALIRSIFLWGSLIAIIIFAFIRFVRQHEGIAVALRRSRIVNWLVLAWQWLYKSADKTRTSLSRAIGNGWQSIVSRLEGKRILPRTAFISLRALDPRQRIYFFYLALVRRGAEQGFARESSQTPSEYAAKLEKALPSAGEDIDSITEAFVEARYSRHEMNSAEANVAKAAWARIRRALQAKARRE